MATPFNNPHVALFFNQMTLGVMDKLEIDETNAGDWFVQHEGDPERHMLHIIDALVGFLGKPHQEFSVSEISKFLAYLQHMLNEEKCTIDVPHLAELYKQVQDRCEGEAEAWKKILLKAEKDGNDSIDEAFIQTLWESIPDNQGSQYEFE